MTTIICDGQAYRRLTSAEVRSLGYRQEVAFITSKQNGVKRVFVSGACKTWKTRPADYRCPVKFGLYESSALVPDSLDPALAAFENSNGAMPVVKVTP